MNNTSDELKVIDESENKQTAEGDMPSADVLSETDAALLSESSESSEPSDAAGSTASEPEYVPDPRYNMNAFERFYSNFDNVPIKYLDIFIGVCIFALVAVITIGIIRAH